MPRVSGWNAATPRRSAPESAAARFELTGSLKTGMTEASDVAALPGGRFIVVGDKKDSAVIVDAQGKRTNLDLPGLKNGKSQLEGVTYDPVRHHLFVSPTGQPQLVLAKEGSPRELSMIGDGGKGKPLPIKLEREVLAVCRDFSAVTVDPKTGHLFISSDEPATVAQVKLVRDGNKVIGKLVQSFPLRDEKGKSLERVEGLSFNDKGDLFVLTENDGKLHQLNRK